MRELMSFLFGLATDPLGLPIVWWKEWLVMGAIGVVAFAVSFAIVGRMYDSDYISTKVGGSIIHWVIRAVVFFILWAITYGVIVAARFVVAHWIVIVSALGGLALVGATIALAIHFKRKGGVANA